MSAFPAKADNLRIGMKGLEFAPSQIEAKVGDSVDWVNDDSFDHTSTARDGTWDVKLKKGETRSMKLEKAGKFPYYCRLHPNMQGVVTVKP